VRERCEEALRALQEAVPCELATLWASAGGQLVPAATVGRPLDLLESVPFDTGVGLRAWVFRSGRVVRIPSRGRGFRDGALQGFLAVPVEHQGRRVGVLVLGRTEGAFGEEEEGRVRALAADLAKALVGGDGGE
jgi:GAF domain-containing protein